MSKFPYFLRQNNFPLYIVMADFVWPLPWPKACVESWEALFLGASLRSAFESVDQVKKITSPPYTHIHTHTSRWASSKLLTGTEGRGGRVCSLCWSCNDVHFLPQAVKLLVPQPLDLDWIPPLPFLGLQLAEVPSWDFLTSTIIRTSAHNKSLLISLCISYWFGFCGELQLIHVNVSHFVDPFIHRPATWVAALFLAVVTMLLWLCVYRYLFGSLCSVLLSV